MESSYIYTPQKYYGCIFISYLTLISDCEITKPADVNSPSVTVNAFAIQHDLHDTLLAHCVSYIDRCRNSRFSQLAGMSSMYIAAVLR